jgi:8-oxo-dGTP pyrophosphatase MutT (NUDIX family)
MKSIRHGVAAIVFRRSKRGVEFLLMHRILRWRGWEPLKGGKEPGETPRQTLTRELKEEIGINPKVARMHDTIPKARILFRIPLKFREQMGGFTHAVYKPFYLVEVPSSAKLNLRKDFLKEHDRLKWAYYKEALKLLTYGNTRAALRKAAKIIAE